LKIPRENIYGNIKFIRGEGKSVTIINPPFPYKEVPEHVQIIAHGFLMVLLVMNLKTVMEA